MRKQKRSNIVPVCIKTRSRLPKTDSSQTIKKTPRGPGIPSSVVKQAVLAQLISLKEAKEADQDCRSAKQSSFWPSSTCRAPHS
jgi:hypothetical protein